MWQEGYEVVQSSKLLKFRAQGQERFTRSKTLGADYSLETLRDRVGKAKQPRRKKKIRLEKDTRINLLMNIQARLQGRGPGMERWMKIHNLKEDSSHPKTVLFLPLHPALFLTISLMISLVIFICFGFSFSFLFLFS